MTTFAERSDEMCNDVDDSYDDDLFGYGCDIPGCDCMTYDLYRNDEEDDDDK